MTVSADAAAVEEGAQTTFHRGRNRGREHGRGPGDLRGVGAATSGTDYTALSGDADAGGGRVRARPSPSRRSPTRWLDGGETLAWERSYVKSSRGRRPSARCMTGRPAESEAIRAPIVDEIGCDHTLADAIREELLGPGDTREASVPNPTDGRRGRARLRPRRGRKPSMAVDRQAKERFGPGPRHGPPRVLGKTGIGRRRLWLDNLPGQTTARRQPRPR